MLLVLWAMTLVAAGGTMSEMEHHVKMASTHLRRCAWQQMRRPWASVVTEIRYVNFFMKEQSVDLWCQVEMAPTAVMNLGFKALRRVRMEKVIYMNMEFKAPCR